MAPIKTELRVRHGYRGREQILVSSRLKVFKRWAKEPGNETENRK